MNNNKAAFTLLEIVLYVFVFAILSVALYNFGNVSFRTNAYSQSVAEVELQGSALISSGQLSELTFVPSKL